jgi:SAM-dependent methyltransferase
MDSPPETWLQYTERPDAAGDAMASRAVSTAPCPACRSERWREHALAGRILALPASYRILRCARCRTSKLDPPLPPQDVEALYGAGYFTLDGAARDRHLDDFQHTSATRQPKFRNVIADLRALLPGGRTILDVGAATGDFVLTAREAGLEAVGVERSRAAVDAASARGVSLLHGDLSVVTGSYDFVHLNHVFEHFTEPLAELGRIRLLLKEGAIVYLEVPYQFNLVERLQVRLAKQRFKCSVHSFHHPYMYTPKSLRRLLESNGFEVPLQRVFDARRYPSAGAVARLKRAAWRCLASVDVGNYIETFARVRPPGQRPHMRPGREAPHG